MAYNGSTAASSIANPPILIAKGVGGGVNTLSTQGTGSGVWLYNSSNGSTEFMAAGYFTDGSALGMRSGDLIMGVCCTGSSANVYMGCLTVVASSGANISSTGGGLSSNR
jgi:hypothetical protein